MGSRIAAGPGRLPRVEVQQTLGGRYRLLNELGSGGMAVVWKARDEVLGRSVAVKLLAGRYAGDEQSRARIRDEARAAATLSHPNIAQIYDFGESDEAGVPVSYVVMELINGPTLAQKVSDGPIPPRSVFRICSEVAAALSAAHAIGLVHRDIKPANVMVTAVRAKVVDFGIAAAAGPGRPDDELLGTPAYLAPERLLSDRIEPASDVYALGVLLYRLLTNESPWSVDTTTQMLDAHVYIAPNPMPQLPGVPPEVTELVHGCLRKEPAERPTAAEASTILADAESAAVAAAAGPGGGAGSVVGAGMGVAAGAALPAAEPPGSNAKRRTAWIGGGVAAATVAALLLWILLPGGSQTGPDSRTAAPGPGNASVLPSAASGVPAVPGKATAPGGRQNPGGPAPVPGQTAPRGTEAVPAPTTGAPTGGEATSTPGPTSTGQDDDDGGGDEPTPAPAATDPPATQGKVLSSTGGTVTAVCGGGKAELTSWAPAEDYKTDKVTAGPALSTAIVFKKKSTRIRMTVTCVLGVPTPVVLPL